MKVYISTRGDTRGILRAKVVAQILEALGHTITFRWWESIEKKIADGVTSDDQLTIEERRQHATEDFLGVKHADLLLYLEPHEKSEGAAWELGVAWEARSSHGRPYIAVMGPRRSFMFSELSDARFEHIEDLVAALPAIAKVWEGEI